MAAEQDYAQPDPEFSDRYDTFQKQRQAYGQTPMPSAEECIQWLKALHMLILREQDAIIEAINQDFGNRARSETLFAEIMPTLHGIHYAAKRVKKWMKPSRRRVFSAFQPACAKVIYQPLGVVGISVPWNYPFFLAMGPLISALAAGNRAMIKMGEASPRLATLLKELMARIFPEDLVAVFPSRSGLGNAFIHLPFDHLLFTGSIGVGKTVMRAAAENLTPVTLELGGKSPAIISQDSPLQEAAQRIGFGKVLNSGQTCVAPDYVLIPRTRIDSFVEAYSKTVQGFLPRLAENQDYTSIINERQFQRLQSYLEDARAKGATLVSLFDAPQGRRLPHTLVLNPTDDMLLMQEEIFGPILPLVPYDDLDEALAYINARPRPLALYYFGYDKAEQTRVLHGTHSGGVCLNDAVMHVAQEDLPFGGVGSSGMGHYHAYEGFLTFSKAKGVFHKGRLNSTQFIYPPYGRWTHRLVSKLFIR